MAKQVDLLPWIFSGILLACVAAAVTVVSHKPAPSISQAPSQAAVHAVPVAAAAAPAAAPVAPAAPAAPAAIPAPTVTAVTAQTVPAPLPPGGEVWECTTNGQKTYSDNPCGTKATLRELSPINIMSSASAPPPPRSYRPDSNYAPESDYAPDAYPSTPDYSDSAYPVLIGIPYRERPRPDHAHRPHPRAHVPPPRKS